jgi:hypothetical protein
MFKKYVIIFMMVGFTSCYIKSGNPVDSPSRSDLLQQIEEYKKIIELVHDQITAHTGSDKYNSDKDLDDYVLERIDTIKYMTSCRDSLKEALDSKK